VALVCPPYSSLVIIVVVNVNVVFVIYFISRTVVHTHSISGRPFRGFLPSRG
jgi:hypothetical protein